jgi:16S rRNA (uracil1498-N3)-methyltransferase
MRIPRIFTSQNLAVNSSIDLMDESAHYLSKVLRMQVGRELILFNGLGGEYFATISAMTKKTVSVNIFAFNVDNRQSSLSLELAIGISRGERMDWVLQKATELGVTKITPLITERTEIKLGGERADKCQRNLLPELSAPMSLPDWMAQCSAELKFVLHHRDNQGLPRDEKITSVALLIGPEGGLNDDEIVQARAQKFLPLTLGPRVLRTETAPIAAISLVQYLWGDF